MKKTNLDKILNEALNKALIGKNKIKQVNSNEIADFVNKQLEAINYTHSCKTLKDKETHTLKDAFIAGYKKRALMSGLKYDEVSELNAITNFKCCLLYTSPSPRDLSTSRMPSSA